MDCKIGDVVRFGRYDDRIGVVIGIEKAGDDDVLLVRTPQNVVFGQAHDYCTPDMEPRLATKDELVAVTIAMRDGIVQRLDEYLAPFIEPPQTGTNRLACVAALAANAVAMLAMAVVAYDVPVVPLIAAAASVASVGAAAWLVIHQISGRPR